MCFNWKILMILITLAIGKKLTSILTLSNLGLQIQLMALMFVLPIYVLMLVIFLLT